MPRYEIPEGPAMPKATSMLYRFSALLKRIEFTPDPLRTDLYDALERGADAVEGMLARKTTDKPKGVRDVSR